MSNPATQTPPSVAAIRGRIVWHELLTTDPAAAIVFYSKVVGWGTQAWENNPDYTMFTAGEKPIGGVMTLPEPARQAGAPPHWITYIEVPDTDATVAQATALGATVLVPPETIPTVGRFAVLQDPQGATFAIIAVETSFGEETDPAPMEFSWHELVTTDWKAGEAFYQALFGWEKKSEFDMGPMGIYNIFGRDRFQYGGMYNKPADMPAPPHWLPYARVESADAAAERGKEGGGVVLHGPMEVPGGDRIAILVDPQGAAFAVHSKATA
jgi:predicted enzyme related to lactoylglutathione lyase